MAQPIVLECKCCGGDIEEVSKGIGKCTSCRRTQSIPVTIDNERINRANRLRKKAIFDEARDMYTKIVNENPEEAEAYWGIVLCRFGIEYVDDYNGEAIPTCHRTIETSIFNDPDFITACEKANAEQKEYYNTQAKLIDDIQKKILGIVKSEKSYDVFISYKSHDSEGNPTVDSKYAQKIYNLLDRKGFRVFFAEETLKKYAGTEYEPHIYSALKSSKVMVLIGGNDEYFEAPWVRNEWSRYLEMIRSGEEKRLLVVYFDIDPYELPNELVKLQAIDWKTADAQNTLLDCVENALGSPDDVQSGDYETKIGETIAMMNQKKAEQKFNNAKMLLYSGNKVESIKIFSEIIKEFPSYSQAYWYRMLAQRNCTEKSIVNSNSDISKDPDFVSAYNTGSDEEKKKYDKIRKICDDNRKLQSDYCKAHKNLVSKFTSGTFENDAVSAYKDKKTQVMQYVDDHIFERKGTKIGTSLFVAIVLALLDWIFVPYGFFGKESPLDTIGMIIVVIVLIVAIIFAFACGSILVGILGIALDAGIGYLLDRLNEKFTAEVAQKIGIVIGILILICLVVMILNIIKAVKNKNLQKNCNGLIGEMEEISKTIKEVFKEEESKLNTDFLGKRKYEDTNLKLNISDEVAKFFYIEIKNIREEIEKQLIGDELDEEAKAEAEAEKSA